MRNAFAKALYEEAVKNPDIYIVTADISPVGDIHKFREEYPDRFIDVGVSEQTMIGVCAGLALKGKQPFAYSIATFSLYRPFEFIRNDLCYQNLPVTVVGMGSGVIYSDHGGTHHTMEDIAIASAIPNMQIIAPCDPLETIEATKWCCQQKNGPVYLRLGKSGEPNLTQHASGWGFNSSRTLKTDDNDGCHWEWAILSYGPIANLAYKVAKEVGGSLVTFHTLKPLDRESVKDIVEVYDNVVVIEEHVPNGGLSSQVKQIAWDIQAKCQLDCFTLKDEFIHCNGRHSDMLAAHGLTLENIIERLRA
jgi:transketolase